MALGKSYDCSFEEYFLDRTFVDPLDPTQGPEAMPLCPDGHEKQVTIHNVREYVMLAKQFMLHDGVIGQAQAFRSGVDDFFSAEYLRLFTPDEIQRDVCGSGDNADNWNEADVRKLLKLDGKYWQYQVGISVITLDGLVSNNDEYFRRFFLRRRQRCSRSLGSSGCYWWRRRCT